MPQYRLEKFTSAVCAVYIARTQFCLKAVPVAVKEKQMMVAFYPEVAVVDCPFLFSVHRALGTVYIQCYFIDCFYLEDTG